MPKYNAVQDRDDDDDQSSPDHATDAGQTNSSSDGDLELYAKGPKDRSGTQHGKNVDFRSAFRRNCNSRNDGTPSPSNLHVVAPANIQRARRLIYASHFVSQFSECAWQFAVVLFLAAVSNYHSILLVSSYYLTTYIAVMLFGSSIGAFLDRSDRLRAARLCIGIENTSVLVASIACCWLLTKTERIAQQHYAHGTETETTNESNTTTISSEPNDASPITIPHDAFSIVLIVTIHIFGSLAMLFNQVFVVAVERDWIVVLSQQAADPEAWLSQTNVLLRQVYLTCKVISPTFAGWVVGDGNLIPQDQGHFCVLHNAAILVGVLCVTSLCVEYICSMQIYRLVPALQECGEYREDLLPAKTGDDYDDDNDDIGGNKAGKNWKDDDRNAEENDKIDENGKGISIRRAISLYLEQPIVWAGLSYAFLNSNALCFGGAMTTYLLWDGMPIEQVGLWRGLSSAIGLAGTFAYKFSARRTTVVKTGAWSIVYLFLWLTVACASFLMNSTTLLVVSAAISRIGLWVFDISYTLIYQENVADGLRGLIGGTQQSLNSFFTMLSGCLGLFFNKPEQFWVIATTGYACIAVSMIMYIFGVYMPSMRPSSSPIVAYTPSSGNIV